MLGPADFGQKNARESGLNEEAGREQAYHFLLKWSQGAERLAAAETNLTIFLNTHVYDVERTDGFRITAARAFDMIDGHLTRYTGDVFIDCTGDGWVGYYAGAETMRGRESRTMFGDWPPSGSDTTELTLTDWSIAAENKKSQKSDCAGDGDGVDIMIDIWVSTTP